MTDGYIYCFSNECMPGILKVGMTERTPEARLKEANASDTWRPPMPYKIEFEKKVYNSSQKEKYQILKDEKALGIDSKKSKKKKTRGDTEKSEAKEKEQD